MREFEKKGFFFLFTFLFFLWPGSLLWSAEEKFVLVGHSACPLFDIRGNLLVLYANERNQLRLAFRDGLTSETGIQGLLLRSKAGAPSVSQNQDRQIGIVWERAHQEIYFGFVKGNEVILCQKIRAERGNLFSPDLSFDRENQPWITWVEFCDGLYYVMVRNLSSGRSWVINSPFLISASNPKIVVTSSNCVWVFWTGRDSGRDQILCSFFEGGEWSFPSSLNKDNRFPHVLQNVALDGDDCLWVVWSAYDGDDYEIYCSRWDGRNWSEEEQVTDNQSADLYPSMAFVSQTIPFIVWKRSNEKNHRIYARYKSGQVWSQEIELAAEPSLIFRGPKVAVRHGRIAVLWESGEKTSGVFFSFSDLQKKESSSSFPTETSSPVINNSLDEDKYVGFGDSITFGAMDFQEAPDKGYIPRLELLLQGAFGKGQVINEGYGGETTVEGLARIQSVIPRHLARFLLLMEGTNDVIFLEISMDTAAFNLEEMARRCLDFGVFPLLATIIPRNDWRWYLELYRNRIYELNDKIRQLAAKLKIPLVDQFHAFYDYPDQEGGWPSLISSDLVHPSEKGYEVMSSKWFQEIQTLPFPPLMVRVQRALNHILFYNQELNVLSWENSPKIREVQKIVAYRIYRQKRGAQNAPFSYVGSVVTSSSRALYKYLDTKIVPADRYGYAISAVRMDGIEGPCSKVVND